MFMIDAFGLEVDKPDLSYRQKLWFCFLGTGTNTGYATWLVLQFISGYAAFKIYIEKQSQ